LILLGISNNIALAGDASIFSKRRGKQIKKIFLLANCAKFDFRFSIIPMPFDNSFL